MLREPSYEIGRLGLNVAFYRTLKKVRTASLSPPCDSFFAWISATGKEEAEALIVP